LLRSGRLRDGIWFGLFVAGQIMSCLYYGEFLALYLAIVCGTLLIADRSMPKRRLLALAAGVVVAMLAVLPLGGANSRRGRSLASDLRAKSRGAALG
jgi:hypothetical protein